jgi:hypothetical protein
MSQHQLSVDVVLVPNTVQLHEDTVYLYKDGQLHDCGALSCILLHLDMIVDPASPAQLETRVGAVREHFSGDWSDYGVNPNSPHVITYEVPE